MAALWMTVKAPRVPVGEPGGRRLPSLTEPTSWPVIVLVATPATAVSLPVPVTVPAPEALAKATTVVLSEVTVLPAASWTVAVSTRVAPEVRLVVAPVRAIWAAAPWTTVKAPSVPVVSPAAVASIVTEPTSWPVTVFVATPATAVSLPVPVTVPAPDALAKATTVVLSEVTVLPAASLSVAVRTRVAPEVRLVVAPVRTMSAAAPWTTVKAPSVPVVSRRRVASIVTEPTSAPVTVLVATPATAVSLPVPVTVPAPEALAKSTTVVLSEVTVLPAASWIVAVSTRVAPEVRLVVAPVRTISVGGAVDDGEGAERAGGETGRGGLHRDRADERAGDVFVATPATAVSLPVPVTVPAPDALPKVTTVELSEVTVLPAASLSVAVRTRVAPEVRLVVAPVRAMSAAAPWTTVKAPSVPVVRPLEVASIVTEPTSWPVTVLVATPATAVSLPVPVTVPAPEALAKATTVVLSEVTVLPAASLIVAVSTRVAPEVRLVVAPVSDDLGGGAVDDGEGAERAGGQPGGGGLHGDGADELRR